jgi:hypothetical protein
MSQYEARNMSQYVTEMSSRIHTNQANIPTGGGGGSAYFGRTSSGRGGRFGHLGLEGLWSEHRG